MFVVGCLISALHQKVFPYSPAFTQTYYFCSLMISAPERAPRRLRCHQALFVEEILLQILSHFPRASLAAAALTCRAWEPAVDLLWSNIDVERLLNVLDPIETQSEGQVKQGSKKPTKDWRWDRFRHLAPKVKTITKESKAASQSSEAAFEMLRGARTSEIGTVLLPNIEAVDWNVWRDEEVEWMNILLCMGPSLRTLRIVTDHVPPTAVFDRLPDISPRLTQLTIMNTSLGGTELDSLCKSLARLPTLEHVTLFLYGPDSLRAVMFTLERHPNLQSLRLHGDNSRTTPWTRTITEPFPALRRLKLNFVIRDTGVLENLTPGSKLISLKLGDRFHLVPDLRATLNAVGLHTGLEELAVRGGSRDGTILRQGFLEPIWLCAGMKILAIRIVQPMELLDEDIEGLADRLPLLQTLSIIQNYSTSSFPIRLTLRAYAVLAASCPRIQSVTFAVDGTLGIAEDTTYPSRNSLVSVNMLGSRLNDPWIAARFFDRLSRGKDLKISFSGTGTAAGNWERVVEILSTLQPISELGG